MFSISCVRSVSRSTLHAAEYAAGLVEATIALIFSISCGFSSRYPAVNHRVGVVSASAAIPDRSTFAILSFHICEVPMRAAVLANIRRRRRFGV